MGRFEDLKQKYQPVLQTIEQQNVHLQNLHVRDNKLFIRGEAPSEDVKNRVWDQIKAVNPQWQAELTADLTVNPALPQQAASRPAQGAQTSGGQGGVSTYTVQAGDSLSKISKHFYGTPNEYMRIFEANRDKLSDPNKIQPGQQLVIPPKAA